MEALQLSVVVVAGMLRFICVLAWQYLKTPLQYLGIACGIAVLGLLLWLLAFLCLGGYAWAALLDWWDNRTTLETLDHCPYGCLHSKGGG